MATPLWTSFTATPIFGRAALRFPGVGTIGEIEIPMHITKLSSQNEGSSVIEVTAGSIIDSTSNLSSGGASVSYGVDTLPKIAIEGFIDTPVTITVSGGVETALPALIIDGFHVTYTEIIAAYYEGRTSTNSSGAWVHTLPRWFRDPFGRVYGDRTPTGTLQVIRIYDFTAARLEAVPGRNTFTMTLQV